MGTSVSFHWSKQVAGPPILSEMWWADKKGGKESGEPSGEILPRYCPGKASVFPSLVVCKCQGVLDGWVRRMIGVSTCQALGRVHLFIFNGESTQDSKGSVSSTGVRGLEPRWHCQLAMNLHNSYFSLLSFPVLHNICHKEKCLSSFLPWLDQ